MKAIVLSIGIGTLGFAFMGYHSGIFNDLMTVDFGEEDPGEVTDDPAGPAVAAVKQPEKIVPPPARKKASFPSDLAPAVRQQPVPQAAPFDRTQKVHKLVFMKPSGLVHDYQENLDEEWQGETVEETELVVVLYGEKKEFLERIPYPPPAPPIDRNRYYLDAYVVEARTGKVLAIRKFINEPRQIRRVELWDTRAIGYPVRFTPIFDWLKHQSLAGFPYDPNPPPIQVIAE